MNQNLSKFKDQERKIIAENSKQRKQAEKKLRDKLEREYWEDFSWSIDRMYDGSDDQPYEPEEK